MTTGCGILTSFKFVPSGCIINSCIYGSMMVKLYARFKPNFQSSHAPHLGDRSPHVELWVYIHCRSSEEYGQILLEELTSVVLWSSDAVLCKSVHTYTFTDTSE